MSKIDGGTMLVRVLRQAGVDTVFTLHGGHLDSILQAARAAGLRLIDTRHEQAAGHAADGWARTTGRPGVVLVTAGPRLHRLRDRDHQRLARLRADAVHRRRGAPARRRDAAAPGRHRPGRDVRRR